MRERFPDYLKKQIEAYKGIAFPVKSGPLKRLLTTKVDVMKLHPNPDDEFTKPEVGPSYRIISEYEQFFRTNVNAYAEEPLIIEKMHPDGYMLINGHHRWAAYYNTGRKKVPVNLVNLTHDADIKKMIESAVHDKRVSLDLDEVVFNSGFEGKLEKKLMFPFGRMYKEDIRLGVPALFHYLAKYGYDIWVYTSRYYSMDYILNYFKHYHVKINGIITGAERQKSLSSMSRSDFDSLIADTYKYTLSIDNDSVVRINTRTKEFEDFAIDKEKGNWADQVMTIIGGFNEEETQ